MPNLTKRVLDAAKPQAGDYLLWCSGTPGFGARIYPSGKKVFVAQVRVGDRSPRRIGYDAVPAAEAPRHCRN